MMLKGGIFTMEEGEGGILSEVFFYEFRVSEMSRDSCWNWKQTVCWSWQILVKFRRLRAEAPSLFPFFVH